MKHISLFSGIGGFDLASEWMGWENVAHCEWNPFGQKILKYYWPGAISYEDITKTDFSVHRGKIDIVTGGFPCQPYSVAGKRKGKEDDRHLWPEMLRAIREIQPSWIVGENVRGLVNWDGGLVFEEVQADLESEGYTVLPFLLPASGVGAPHQRERIWFVAYSESFGGRKGIGAKADSDKWETGQHISEGAEVWNWDSAISRAGIFDDTHNERREESDFAEESAKQEQFSGTNSEGRPNWQYFPTQSPIRFGNDGFSSKLDGITFSKWRNESIKAGGNAIVPQVAFQIFQAISEYENLQNHG